MESEDAGSMLVLDDLPGLKVILMCTIIINEIFCPAASSDTNMYFTYTSRRSALLKDS